MKKKHMSFSGKLILTYGVLVVVACAILGTLSLTISRSILLNKEQASMQTEAELLADEISQKLDGELAVMETIARNQILTDSSYTVDEKNAYCWGEMEPTGFNTVLYASADGKMILPSNYELDLVEIGDVAFAAAKETGESSYNAVVTNESGSFLVTAAVPVFDDAGNFAGAVISTINTSDFASLLGDDMEAFIVDPDGFYIGHTEAANFLYDENGDAVVDDDGYTVLDGEGVNLSINPITMAETDPSYQETADLIQTMLSKGQGITTTTSMLTGAKQYVAYTKVEGIDWSVAYLVDASEITSAANELAFKVIIISLVIVAISLVLSWWVSKKLIRPLVDANTGLADIIEGIQKGEGDLTRRLEPKSGDEIGSIITAINDYTEVLQGVTLKIKDGTTHLYSSVQNMTEFIDASNSQAMDNSSIMEELSASMTEVNESTENMRSMMDDIHSEIIGIAEDAKSGMSLAQGINQKAEEIKNDSVQSQQNTIDMIQKITETLRVSIENSRQVNKINDLTQDILAIASQTNLLALNASIEAARAGESGKGFAVVADEIRQLADNSRETANSIQTISNEVNDAVTELVNDTNHLLDYINTDIISDYSGMVSVGDTYAEAAMKMQNMMETLSTGAEDMRGKADYIQDLINGTAKAIEESAKAVSEAAINTESLVTSIQEIDDEMASNQQVASGLSVEVQRFKRV